MKQIKETGSFRRDAGIIKEEHNILKDVRIKASFELKILQLRFEVRIETLFGACPNPKLHVKIPRAARIFKCSLFRTFIFAASLLHRLCP
jgi:hypothetical protein